MFKTALIILNYFSYLCVTFQPQMIISVFVFGCMISSALPHFFFSALQVMAHFVDCAGRVVGERSQSWQKGRRQLGCSHKSLRRCGAGRHAGRSLSLGTDLVRATRESVARGWAMSFTTWGPQQVPRVLITKQLSGHKPQGQVLDVDIISEKILCFV